MHPAIGYYYYYECKCNNRSVIQLEQKFTSVIEREKEFSTFSICIANLYILDGERKVKHLLLRQFNENVDLILIYYVAKLLQFEIS